MADLTKITKIIDNPRECVFAFQYQYVDGGDESAVNKIDVSALEASANGDVCSGLRIAECWWVISAMTVEVLADADVDIIVMHLTEDQSGYQDFSMFGGLPTTSSYGANGTGDIDFTTTGAGAAGDSYNIVIRAIKQY
jgi:hypothetical protein|tara:strand:+ start:57 stop:470 length:414 start_codon:yes stop_codon:yes gene_type:complete